MSPPRHDGRVLIAILAAGILRNAVFVGCCRSVRWRGPPDKGGQRATVRLNALLTMHPAKFAPRAYDSSDSWCASPVHSPAARAGVVRVGDKGGRHVDRPQD